MRVEFVLQSVALAVLSGVSTIANAALASGLASESRPVEDCARDAGRGPVSIAVADEAIRGKTDRVLYELVTAE